MIHADRVPALPHTSTGSAETPSTPRQRIPRVIARLREPDRPLPHAFAEGDLRRAVTVTGLEFADARRQSRYHDAILEALGYE